MALKIQVTLKIDGEDISGELSRVSGAGTAAMWHFTVNKYYCGQLFNTATGWRYSGPRFEKENIAQALAAFIPASEDPEKL